MSSFSPRTVGVLSQNKMKRAMSSFFNVKNNVNKINRTVTTELSVQSMLVAQRSEQSTSMGTITEGHLGEEMFELGLEGGPGS